MTFWLIMITFFISVFYYSLSPRTDKVNVEQPIGEAAVVSLVSQHQGAKNYTLQRMQGADYNPSYTGSESAWRAYPKDMVLKMRPFRGLKGANSTSDTTLKYGTDATTFVSVFACINPDRSDQLADNCTRESDKYLVTYGFQQDGWSETVKRKEYWRTAISKLTYNSNECGTLIRRDDLATPSVEYAVDTPYATTKEVNKTENGVEKTTRELKQTVPPAITNKMADMMGDEALPDMLFCLTKWRRPYEQSGLVLHLDAVNNSGSGHKEKGSHWVNLGIDSAYSGQIHGNPVWSRGGLTLDGVGDYVSTRMTQRELGGGFTITAVVRFADQSAIENGSLWGAATQGDRPRFVGGAPDKEAKVLKFGLSDAPDSMIRVPFDRFRVAGDLTRPVQLTYVVSMSASLGGAWHALYIDNEKVPCSKGEGENQACSLGSRTTASDMADRTLDFGRVNGANSGFRGTFYNLKVYDRPLARTGCHMQLKKDENGQVVKDANGVEVYECASGYSIVDKQPIYQNYLWDRRRFGVGGGVSGGVRLNENITPDETSGS